jgi:hypothetical protein
MPDNYSAQFVLPLSLFTTITTIFLNFLHNTTTTSHISTFTSTTLSLQVTLALSIRPHLSQLCYLFSTTLPLKVTLALSLYVHILHNYVTCSPQPFRYKSHLHFHYVHIPHNSSQYLHNITQNILPLSEQHTNFTQII